jgi:hypothetical protein
MTLPVATQRVPRSAGMVNNRVMNTDDAGTSAGSFAMLTDFLDTTDTVTIVTRQASGEEKSTPIWSVVADGKPYVRSAFGPDSWWYRRALARRTAAFPLDGESVQVRLEHIQDPATIDAVDAAFSTKYADQPADLKPVLRDESRACTLLIRPA